MRLDPDPIAFRHLPDAPADPERPLDLHRWLVRSPASTFLMRAADDRLARDGIRRGDLVVVDRAADPATGDLVVAEQDGGLVLRHLPGADAGAVRIWGAVVGLARRIRP